MDLLNKGIIETAIKHLLFLLEQCALFYGVLDHPEAGPQIARLSIHFKLSNFLIRKYTGFMKRMDFDEADEKRYIQLESLYCRLIDYVYLHEDANFVDITLESMPRAYKECSFVLDCIIKDDYGYSISDVHAKIQQMPTIDQTSVKFKTWQEETDSSFLRYLYKDVKGFGADILHNFRLLYMITRKRSYIIFDKAKMAKDSNFEMKQQKIAAQFFTINTQGQI